MHQPVNDSTSGTEPEFRCPALGDEEHDMRQSGPANAAFRIGPFNVGDLIALGGVTFACGALWFQVGMLQADVREHKAASAAEKERIALRLQALEQVIPSEYVRRAEYREDLREVKALLEDIRAEVRGKVDRPQ